jgi:hypothetical protein
MSARPVLVRLLLSLGSWTAAIPLAAVAAPAAPASAAPALPDACGILTHVEVQAVFGAPLSQGTKSTDVPNGCDYLSLEGSAFGAAIEVRPGGAAAFEQIQAANRQKRLPTTELVGLGDRAMAVTLPNEPGTAVYVVHREMLIAVFVNAKDASRNFSIAMALARQILNRI